MAFSIEWRIVRRTNVTTGQKSETHGVDSRTTWNQVKTFISAKATEADLADIYKLVIVVARTP